MAASTNHHFPAATVVVCGQTYSALGTKGSWDSSSGTHGLHEDLQWELGQGGGQSVLCRVVAAGPDAPVTRGHVGMEVSGCSGWSQTPGYFCLCREVGSRRHHQPTLQASVFW